ncbi:uncharacterized protein LOC141617469 [Silene latifolia]|uniref:uncharacterized protein LOC141617469 n=1 Tax=Silene latifolia TaxID=37657 RepID=UPI003D76F596
MENAYIPFKSVPPRFRSHENLQLPVPVRDDITILGDALGSFIQWPETHIYLAKISPPPQQRKAVGGTKKTALADKPKSTDMPTTSSRQQLDEGTKKTDKPKSPVLPATTTSSLKEQVDEVFN